MARRRHKYEALWCFRGRSWVRGDGCEFDEWHKVERAKYRDLRAEHFRTRVNGVEDKP